MLKFWKKKPAVDDPPVEKANPLLPPKARSTPESVTDEFPVSALLARKAPVSLTASLKAHPELAEDNQQIDLAVTAEHPVDPRLFETATPKEAEVPLKRSWRERLSGSGFAKGLGGLFARNPPLDDDLLDELESCLITADVGVSASTEIVEELRKRMAKREFADADALLAALRTRLIELLKPVEHPLDVGGYAPFVLLMVGVNGVGKTTTIGKIARRFLHQGRNIILAAGDTFRAAAVEQLEPDPGRAGGFQRRTGFALCRRRDPAVGGSLP